MIIDVLNALAIAFLATETPEWRSLRKHRLLICVVTFINITLSDKFSQLVAWVFADGPIILTWGRNLVQNVVSPLEWLGASIGSAGLVALLLVFVVILVLAATSDPSSSGGTVRNAAYVIVFGLGTFGVLVLSGVDAHIHYQEPMKVLTLLIVFGGACLADVRRTAPQMPAREFLQNAVAAIRFVMPVCPCISIAISTALMVIVTILEDIHVDPHFLNSFVYWATMYG